MVEPSIIRRKTSITRLLDTIIIPLILEIEPRLALAVHVRVVQLVELRPVDSSVMLYFCFLRDSIGLTRSPDTMFDEIDYR